MKLPQLLDGSVRHVFPSSFYCSILIRRVVFIASAKIPEREGSILSSSFARLLITSVNPRVTLFVTAVPFPQSYKTEAVCRNLVCVCVRVCVCECVSVCVECLQMIKQMMVGFCWNMMFLLTLDVDFESTCTV